MSPDSRDLTIESALADPMIRAAMAADRVDPVEVEAMLRAVARRIEGTHSSMSVVPACRAPRTAWLAAGGFCFA